MWVVRGWETVVEELGKLVGLGEGGGWLAYGPAYCSQDDGIGVFGGIERFVGEW